MKTNYLLPHGYKKIGWFIFIPAFVFGFFTVLYEYEPEFLDMEVFGFFVENLTGNREFFGYVSNNILNEILGILVILGGILVAFSKTQEEDEFISKVRLESLVWATYVNYGVLFLTFAFVYDFAFFWIMIFNMFTILLFFIVRFHWQVWKFQNTSTHEE